MGMGQLKWELGYENNSAGYKNKNGAIGMRLEWEFGCGNDSCMS